MSVRRSDDAPGMVWTGQVTTARARAEGESKYSQTSRTRGSNSVFALRGTIRTLVGATTAGRDRT